MNATSLAAIAAGFIAITGVGYFFGPPPKKQGQGGSPLGGLSGSLGGVGGLGDHGGGLGGYTGAGMETTGSNEDSDDNDHTFDNTTGRQQQLSSNPNAMLGRMNQLLTHIRALAQDDQMEKVKQLLQMAEPTAQQIGENSAQFASVVYFRGVLAEKDEKDFATAKQLYTKSFNIFIKCGDLTNASALCNQILILLTKARTDDETDTIQYYDEFVEWTGKSLQYNTQQTPEKRKPLLFRYAVALSNAGQFAKCETCFAEILELCDEEAIQDRFVYTYRFASTCLLPQKKIDEIVHEIEKLKDRLRKSITSNKFGQIPPQFIANLICTSTTLQASYLFDAERFSESEEKLFEAVKCFAEHNIPCNPQLFVDLACCAWELGEDTAAKSYFNELQVMSFERIVLLEFQPKSVSKYLKTSNSILENSPDGTVYKLELTLQPDLVARQEGQYMTKRSTKVTGDFYVQASFESTDPVSGPVVVTKHVPYSTVKDFKFEIESPKIKLTTPKRFYEVTIIMFKDQNKQHRIGVHHQLVSSIYTKSDYDGDQD